MSRRPKDPRPRRALTLREHIDASTVAELQEFLKFWSPHEKHRNGRAALVEKIERLMRDENVVYAKVDLLSERVRAVLLALLRKSHYTADLHDLFRGIDGLEMEYYEGEAALTALARRGFVRVNRASEWRQYGRAAYAVPKELALVMRGLAGGDQRPLAEIFTHAAFTPGRVEASGNEDPVPLPDDVDAAIASLDGADLRTVAREGIERYGGILTRHEFADVFGPRDIRWQSARFVEEFGARGLGTVGHVDLRDKGIGVDDDVLVFFAEAVERRTEEMRTAAPKCDVVLAGHGDLMSDIRTTLGLVKEFPVKIAKEGSVYKAARARIADRLQFPEQPLLDRIAVANRVIALVRNLGLATNNGNGQLSVTEKGETWPDRPLAEKVRDARALLLRDGTNTLRSLHLRRVLDILVDLLTSEEGRDVWWPCPSLSMLARNRYLLELAESEDGPGAGPLSVRHAALTELGAAAQDLVVRELFALGLVDVALRDDAAVAVRLSGLGRRILLEEGDGAADGARPLVVNPDFELLVLPEGDVDELLHALDRIAVRTRTGEVVQYKLDQERIERVTVEGESPESIVELLESHSRAPVPQNVAYSIRSWGSQVQSATLARGVLFVANDAAVLEAVKNHGPLKGHIAEVLGPTSLFFEEGVDERRLAQELRALGVYLR